ncbi:MAG: TssN family type VI secretion system protein [Cryomorphaceae bacterium]|nr:TssN family type VI secretion system protein [Flavobacteriales bacterium]
MSNPAAQAKSTFAQSKGVQSKAKSKFARGKAVKAKSARFDKATVKHLLIFLVVGLVLGCTVFIPFFSYPGLPLAKYTYLGLSVLGILIGTWSHRRAGSKIEWYSDTKFISRVWTALGVFVSVFLGMLIIYTCISMFTGLAEISLSLSLLMASAPLTSLIPLFFSESFERAASIEPKEYSLWMYPENYIEKQPTWNRERIVFANLHFKRNPNENLITTVKVKLPKEALLGELVYLFIRDYNENRSPEKPIVGIGAKDGVEGWLFRTNNKGMRALFKKRRYVDTDITIEDNRIEEDQDLFFERVINSEA